MVALESLLGASRSFSSRVGEVVSTSVAEFEAQCPRLHDAPPLGALVRVQVDDDVSLYGVVADCSTDGVDASSRPVPRGRDGCEDADVYRAYPDLVYVLRTCFRAVVVGFRRAGAMYQYLPPTAAPIHYSVSLCPYDEIDLFTRRLDYFRILLAAPNVPTEEVLAAHVRVVMASRAGRDGAGEDGYGFAVRAGREVAALLKGDHQRLVAILERMRPAVAPVPSMPA